MTEDDLDVLVDDLRQLSVDIVKLVPEGRARSLALTKLDEARLWVQEAILVADQAADSSG